MKQIFYVLIILASLLIAGCAAAEEPGYPVVDKYEARGSCYLTVEVEVTPEEYIGYDRGDEYEVRND